jgi:putative ABC transport system substrate-binding protein
MRRREFVVGLGSATAWPLAARAQQAKMPVVGLLDILPPFERTLLMTAFRRGLSDTGYVEGRNVAIEYRSLEYQFDRLPGLAADLVGRQADVIFVVGPPAVRAINALTKTIPVVFTMGEDPVKEGIVASLNRPGGNVTGTVDFTNQLIGKEMEVLRQAVPKAKVFAFLISPNNPNAEPDTREAQVAADALGRELRVLKARSEAELEAAFATMAEQRVGGLLVGSAVFGAAERLAALAAHYAIPAIYPRRDYSVSGGLMSYSANKVEAWHLCGVYVGRILKGEKPADLPVMQTTKWELVINLKTAKALGLDIPPMLLALADEVIE